MDWGAKARRLANQISLKLRYVGTTAKPDEVKKLCDESILLAKNFFSELDPSEPAIWYEGLHKAFVDRKHQLEAPQVWQVFVAKTCDHWHTLGLHEKSIKELGSVLSEWDQVAVSWSDLANSLDDLCELVFENAAVLSATMGQNSSNAEESNAFLLALIMNGVALILDSIEQAIQKKQPSSIELAAVANFGAALVRLGCSAITDACGASKQAQPDYRPI